MKLFYPVDAGNCLLQKRKRLRTSTYSSRSLFYLDMRLFKYIKKEFLASLLERDQIRIGTLFEYRKDENIERGDPLEGKGDAYSYIAKGTFENVTDIPYPFKTMIMGDGKNIRFVNCTFEAPFDVKDQYIFCTTLAPNKKNMESFECDRCFEIADLHMFTNRILQTLDWHRKLINPVIGGDMCIYSKTKILNIRSEEDMSQAYFLKEKRLEHQQEYRILFQTAKEDNITGQVMIVPGLRNYIREVKLI